QVCISLQRLFIHEKVYDTFLDEFIKSTKSLKVGDPLLDDTDVGPMIDIKEAERAENWIKEAVDKGAKILVGGKREEAILHPTILSGVNDSMRLCREEIFAPVVSVFKYSNFNEAVEQANNTDYGLQAGVFTKDLEKAFYAIDNIDVGGVMINDSSMYRVDHMPYGGNKKSGLGREGVKYAIDEMTNIRMVVFNLS
ncbi:MAG: aldehyde dehydrogenase family protein, partial [Deferribacterota bacterium]|nr:aldehyde dehydrogenase family protein [Deferribacterota bacterium]